MKRVVSGRCLSLWATDWAWGQGRAGSSLQGALSPANLISVAGQPLRLHQPPMGCLPWGSSTQIRLAWGACTMSRLWCCHSVSFSIIMQCNNKKGVEFPPEVQRSIAVFQLALGRGGCAEGWQDGAGMLPSQRPPYDQARIPQCQHFTLS